jgi:hypothetical protein
VANGRGDDEKWVWPTEEGSREKGSGDFLGEFAADTPGFDERLD